MHENDPYPLIKAHDDGDDKSKGSDEKLYGDAGDLPADASNAAPDERFARNRTIKVRMLIGHYAGDIRELQHDAAEEMIALGRAERVTEEGLVGRVLSALKKRL